MMLNENPNEPFAKKIEKLILNKSVWNSLAIMFSSGLKSKNTRRKSILVIDESDVFIN